MKKIATILLAAAFAGAASAQGLINRGLLNRAGGRPTTLPTSAAGASALGATGSQKTSDPGASKVDVGGRSIEFNGAALDIVLMVYGNLVGKTVLKDPSAPAASITLQPKQGQELSDEDKILAIETVLEMNGVHLEPYGEKFVRALPRNKADVEVIPLIMDPDAELNDTMRVVSILLSFQNIALDEAQKALEGLKSEKGAPLKVYERTGQILVTDTELNVKRMREIARRIDIPTPVTENVFVRQIKFALASDIKAIIDGIVQESQKELEKQGKQANNAQQRTPTVTPFQPNRLLGGRSNNQPVTSTVRESLVTSVSDADRGMIRGRVVVLDDERSNKIIFITSKSNMDFFDKVIEQLDVETTPDIAVKVYRLKYADSEDVADMINDLIGNAASSKSGSKGNQNQNARNGTGGNMTRTTTAAATQKKSVNQRTGETKTGELSKDNTTVLADKRINGLVVMTNKELVPTLEQIIESMDIKLSQVLIETVIVEVTLGNGINFGIDWIQNGRYQPDGGSWTTVTRTDSYGRNFYNYTDGNGTVQSMVCDSLGINDTGYTTKDNGATYQNSEGETVWTRIGDAFTDSFWQAADVVKGKAFTGDAGYAQALSGGAGNGSQAAAALLQSPIGGATSNLVGSALNYVFKSDKLNLSAVIQATKQDERAKYIASPVVMTVDNKEATIDATSARQFITGWSAVSGYNGSGMPTPQYTSKDIGIKVKVTPKINPNGTVMLEVEEEYNQVAGKQDMLVPTAGQTYETRKIDIPTTRKMSSDVLLENMQTVVFGGLVESYKSSSLTGIPWLMDIPWIGKWLFSKVVDGETRTELLVFMTPYVLDDGESAQAEALRRKKTMSDPRPWEDNGWSLSPLADPVSKKEQIRRLKDEAKKQDEERKTKLAIEKWKVDRVKELKNLSKEERDLWLELHKEELSDEAEKEALEKKMEAKADDEPTQEELRKLAASIREKKLAEAEKEIKTADEEMAAENERGKLDAAKKAGAAEKVKAEGEAKKPESANAVLSDLANEAK